MRVFSAHTFFSQLKTHIDNKEPLYGFLCKDESDLKQLLRDFTLFIHQNNPQIQIKKVLAAETPPKELFHDLRSVDLFSPQICFVVEGLDQWDKSVVDEFLSIATKKDTDNYYVFSADASSTSLKGMAAIKKHALFLDLSKEKPWDKKKRFAIKLVVFAKSFSKVLPMQVATDIIDYFGMNMQKLLTEVEKLCLLSGKNNTLSFNPSNQQEEQTIKSWHIVDKIMDKTLEQSPSYLEVSDFYAISHQLRSRLYLAIALKENNENYIKKSSTNPSLLKKYGTQYGSFSLSYFIHCLKQLNNVELLSRTLQLKGNELLDILIGKIRSYG